MAVSEKIPEAFRIGVASAGLLGKRRRLRELEGAKASAGKMKIAGIEIYKYDGSPKSPFRILARRGQRR